MSGAVPCWWNEDGHTLCCDCAADARKGGAYLTLGHIPPGETECDACRQTIDEED